MPNECVGVELTLGALIGFSFIVQESRDLDIGVCQEVVPDCIQRNKRILHIETTEGDWEIQVTLWHASWIDAELVCKDFSEMLRHSLRRGSSATCEYGCLNALKCLDDHIDVGFTVTHGGTTEIRGEESDGVDIPGLNPVEYALASTKLDLELEDVFIDHLLIDQESTGGV